MTNFKFEAWPTEFRTINQYFGANPQNYSQFGLPGHEGLDIMAPDGSKVFAVAPGTIFSVRTDPNGHNYGIHVRINHIESYQTTYAHLKQAFVTVGQVITAGAPLGLANNTGNSFGSHLHLTLKKLDSNYLNWPHNITDPTPFTLPLLGWNRPAGPYVEGWGSTLGLTLGNGLAQVNAGGINLRKEPSINGPLIVLVPASTIVIVSGAARGQYVPLQVPRAAVGLPDPTPAPPPAPPPPPTTATVDGFGFADYLAVTGGQAIVGQVGINLRAAPSRTAPNIGLVKGGSTVTVLGAQQGEYRPVRVRQEDFQGPVSLPGVPPAPVPTPGGPPQNLPPDNMVLGWAWTQNITVDGQQAVIGAGGINLRAAADQAATKVGGVKEGALTVVVGPARGAYTPIWVRKDDIVDLVVPMPVVSLPDPFPAGGPPPPPPAPIPDTTPGWAFTTQMTITGQTAIAGQYGLNLRQAPRRDAANLGFIPANTALQITGAPQGEYTPVRVDDRVLQPALGTGAEPAAGAGPAAETPSPDPQPLGQARIGLHASADPGIAEAEFKEFTDLRPGIIKVLSFHDDAAIRRLAQASPDAAWIVRAFLDFGGRNISPQQFLTDTLPDVKRSLNALPGKDVVVELHNEPNIIQEGLGQSWSDGATFAAWWLDVLGRYRQALPGVRFIYPGLSPGSSVSNLKQDHIQFVEASRAAVEAADGLGVHLYWSAVSPLRDALSVLDDFISRFRFKPIWITEASNNKAGTTVPQKAQQYLQLWQELQKRPTVKGVTYFVASASNQTFAEEIWVGRGIGAMVGRR